MRKEANADYRARNDDNEYSRHARDYFPGTDARRMSGQSHEHDRDRRSSADVYNNSGSQYDRNNSNQYSQVCENLKNASRSISRSNNSKQLQN